MNLMPMYNITEKFIYIHIYIYQPVVMYIVPIIQKMEITCIANR